MARLGRGRQRASQREEQIKQRKLAETPNSKGGTWDTCLHVCQTYPHHRPQACGPIRELISSSPLSSWQSGLVYVCCCVEIGFCCFTHRSDGDCETLPATQHLSLTLAANLVLPWPLACRLVVRRICVLAIEV